MRAAGFFALYAEKDLALPLTLKKALAILLIGLGVFILSCVGSVHLIFEFDSLKSEKSLDNYSESFEDGIELYLAKISIAQESGNLVGLTNVNPVGGYLSILPFFSGLSKICIYDGRFNLIEQRYNSNHNYSKCTGTLTGRAHNAAPNAFYGSLSFFYGGQSYTAELHISPTKQAIHRYLGVDESLLLVIVALALADILAGGLLYHRFYVSQRRRFVNRVKNTVRGQKVLEWVCIRINDHLLERSRELYHCNELIETDIRNNVHKMNQSLNIINFSVNEVKYRLTETPQLQSKTDVTVGPTMLPVIARAESAVGELEEQVIKVSDARLMLNNLHQSGYCEIHAPSYLKTLSKQLEQLYQEYAYELRTRCDNCKLPIDESVLEVLVSCFLRFGLCLDHRGAVISVRNRGETLWFDVISVRQQPESEPVEFLPEFMTYLETIESLLNAVKPVSACSLSIDIFGLQRLKMRIIFKQLDTSVL